jgi:integrase
MTSSTSRPRHQKLLDRNRTLLVTSIRAGEDVKTVQAALGHASAVETLETYAGLWPDNEQRTRAAVDGLGLSSKVQRG